MSKIPRFIIERRKPTNIFFPLLPTIRRGEENGVPFRIVEGYAYCNAWVGDGYNLKRSAMVGAADDYMRWGAVREMHQPSAVGTATGSVTIDAELIPLGVIWDEGGAFLRSKVVDSEAIAKLDSGVYKGYSVGIKPTVMRGLDVETCIWIETSLVDRPADPDAVLTLIRAEGIEAADQTFEVVRYWDSMELTLTPKTFGQMREDLAEDDLKSDLYAAFCAFMDSIQSILMAEVSDASAMIRQSMQEFSDYMLSDILPESAEGVDMTEEQRGTKALLLRAARERWRGLTRASSALSTSSNELAVTRAELATARTATEGAETQRNEFRDALAAARERIAVLERLPDPNQPRPIRSAVPGMTPAPERPFWPNQAAAPNEEAVALRAELTELSRTLRDNPDEKARVAGVNRMQVIKARLSEMGEG